MAIPLARSTQPPPPLYRLARALRRASVIALVLLFVFVVSAVYSTAQLARSSPRLGPLTVGYGSNDTVILAGTITLSNPGFYPIDGLSVHVSVDNATGVYLGAYRLGPVSVAGEGDTAYPVDLYLPLALAGPGASLITTTQNLAVSVWGNATIAYLFPVGIQIQDNRSWGAPFDELDVTPGTPVANGTNVTVPVTISFSNQANSADVGTYEFSVVSSAGLTCGRGSFSLSVGPGQPFDQTEPVTLSAGCSPAGGHVSSAFVTPGYTIPLPSEPIP